MRKSCLVLLTILCLAFAQIAKAYDETYTHPYLTRLMVEAWNKTHQLQINQEQADYLLLGSQDEDWPAYRSLNHFYNPQNGQGLTINDLPVGESAPEWLMSSTRQSTAGADFSWQQALLMCEQEETSSAWTALGHALHLLEDMGQPAHTRNDEHAYGDLYESWIKEQNSRADLLAVDIINIKPATCASPQACLESMAQLSSRNFFSQDTLNSDLPEPWQRTVLNKNNYLTVAGRPVALLKNKQLTLDEVTHRATWRYLSREIVSHGLRLIELFLNSTGSSVEIKNKPRLSAGGVKISAGQTTPQFNNKKIEPTWSSEVLGLKIKQIPSAPFWPVIDLSRVMDPRFWRGVWPDSPLAPPSAKQIVDQPVVSITPTAPTSTAPVNSPTSENTSVPTSTPPVSSDAPPTTPEPDITAPVIDVWDLPATYNQAQFNFSWTASDKQSQKLTYDLAYRLNKTPEWTDVLIKANKTSIDQAITATDGSVLYWRLRAYDEAGNVSDWLIKKTVLVEPSVYNPLLYEGLNHLYHFDECEGRFINDTVGQADFSNNARWVDGLWGCGWRQGWSGSESIGTLIKPMSDDFTLAWQQRDVSEYPLNYSRNRISVGDKEDRFEFFSVAASLVETNITWQEQVWQLKALPTDHNWHSVVVVVSKATIKLYVDGVWLDEIVGDFSILKPAELLFVRGENSPTEFDELAVWQRALSGEEILLYYNKAKPLRPL